MPEKVQQVLKTAQEAARKAGRYLLDNRGRVDRETAGEKQKNDFVTEVDKTSEKMIIEHILSDFPDHQVLAEESGARQTSSAFQWIIDPLDGTTNFVHNIPVFTVSVAVKQDDKVIAGVVYQPVQDEMFTAVQDKGARLNGVPIRVSDTGDFSRAFLATGFPHHCKRRLPQFARAFSDIFFYSAGVRRLGSAALDLCYTACGRFDAFWETGLNAWDVAAGSLVVQEAGGLVSDFWGNSNYLDSGFIVAGSPIIHKRLVEILSTYFEGHRNE
jgi:myo-inositol-1(or 4)-monophosphatase